MPSRTRRTSNAVSRSRDVAGVRTILTAVSAAVLLAGCSGAPAAAPTKTSAAATATPISSPADPPLCRAVAKASRALLVNNEVHDDESLILAVGAIMELDDSHAASATPALRDEVWALADTAQAWIAAYTGPESEFDEAQDALASALVAVDDACTAAGYPLQR